MVHFKALRNRANAINLAQVCKPENQDQQEQEKIDVPAQSGREGEREAERVQN